MSVTIRKMTDDEFERFYGWSIENHAKKLVEQLHISQEEAIRQTIEEVAEMLPNGLNSPNNDLVTIVEEESGESAGFIWTLHEETMGRKQSFLCDFAIWETKRRKGYGQAALSLAEKKAKDAGCQESVLFVADDNAAAKALYEKCGYQPLRRKDHGQYMIKQLAMKLESDEVDHETVI